MKTFENILVTGGGGFIGSHLVECLMPLSRHVKAFVHYNSKNNWGWLETSEIKNNINYGRGYHSSSDVKGKNCWVCHSEHHGRNFRIINFYKKYLRSRA